MTSGDILDAIGELDDELISAAEARRPAAYYVKRALGIGAACAAVFAALAVIVPTVFFTFFFRATSPDPSYTETEPQTEYLTLYIVKNDEILPYGVYLERSPEAVFDEWRSLCGISRDVKLEKCSVVKKETDGGQPIRLMQLTLSEPFTDQIDGADGEMLRDSLEQTLTEIFGVDGIEITYGKDCE